MGLVSYSYLKTCTRFLKLKYGLVMSSSEFASSNVVTSYATEFDNIDSDLEEFQISNVFLLG